MTESVTFAGMFSKFLDLFQYHLRRSPVFPNRSHISTRTAFLLLSPSTYDNMDSYMLSIR